MLENIYRSDMTEWEGGGCTMHDDCACFISCARSWSRCCICWENCSSRTQSRSPRRLCKFSIGGKNSREPAILVLLSDIFYATYTRYYTQDTVRRNEGKKDGRPSPSKSQLRWFVQRWAISDSSPFAQREMENGYGFLRLRIELNNRGNLFNDWTRLIVIFVVSFILLLLLLLLLPPVQKTIIIIIIIVIIIITKASIEIETNGSRKKLIWI